MGNYQPPKAIGEVRYVDDTELKAEIADFRTALEANPTGFVEPFMTAPSPGIIAAAMKNEYYDNEETYLADVAAAIQVEYEAIVKSGFLLQLDCPDLALERHLTYNDRPDSPPEGRIRTLGPRKGQHFFETAAEPGETNRRGSQSRILTIDKGRFTVRRARLAPAMISTPGLRASRRRQRGALPAWSEMPSPCRTPT